MASVRKVSPYFLDSGSHDCHFFIFVLMLVIRAVLRIIVTSSGKNCPPY